MMSLHQQGAKPRYPSLAGWAIYPFGARYVLRTRYALRGARGMDILSQLTVGKLYRMTKLYIANLVRVCRGGNCVAAKMNDEECKMNNVGVPSAQFVFVGFADTSIIHHSLFNIHYSFVKSGASRTSPPTITNWLCANQHPRTNRAK